MKRIAIVLLFASTAFAQLRVPSLLVTNKTTDSTIVLPNSIRTDSIWGNPRLYLGRANNYGGYFAYWDSTGNFHVGDPFVVGAPGANRKKTIIDPGNQYDFEINVSGVSGGSYPFNIYCTEYDTTYYWSVYNQWGGAPKIYSSYPLHLYGAKNKANLIRDWDLFACFDSLGKKRFSIQDTNAYSPIKTFDLAGTLKARFGQRCSTQYAEQETLKVNKQIILTDAGDTTKIYHSGDTVHVTSTASWVHFNKNVKVDSFLLGNSYYGGMYMHNDAGTTFSFASAGVWYTFTGLTAGTLSGFTFSDSMLTATYGSEYRVSYTVTHIGQNNHLYHCAIARNDSIQANTETHMKAAAGETHTLSGLGHLQVLAGNKIKLKIQDAGGTGDGTIYNVNIILERIGN